MSKSDDTNVDSKSSVKKFDASFFDEVIDRKGTNSFKWDHFDEDVLPMWVADMDFKCPPCVHEAIKKRAEHPVFGYTKRSNEYHKSIIDWMKRRFDWEITEEQMTFSAGIVQASMIAVQAFTAPGEYVIVNPPVYYPFFWAVENNGRRLRKNQLILKDGHYEIDWEDLENAMAMPECRMFLFCSPHNPTGRVWTEDELFRIAQMCVKHDVLMVSDEIHMDLVLRGDVKHIPYAKVCHNPCLTLVAPSKTFNVAGLFNSVVISSQKTLLQRFAAHASKCGVFMSNLFGSLATEVAYREGEPWLEGCLDYLSESRTIVGDFLKEKIPEITLIRPEGTYLFWLDCHKLWDLIDPKHENKDALNEFFLKKAKVACNDGNMFRDGGEGFMRLNVGCPHSQLREALERLEKAVLDAKKEKGQNS